MRLCGSDVISCEPSLAPTASIEAYLENMAVSAVAKRVTKARSRPGRTGPIAAPALRTRWITRSPTKRPPDSDSDGSSSLATTARTRSRPDSPLGLLLCRDLVSVSTLRRVVTQQEQVRTIRAAVRRPFGLRWSRRPVRSASRRGLRSSPASRRGRQRPAGMIAEVRESGSARRCGCRCRELQQLGSSSGRTDLPPSSKPRPEVPRSAEQTRRPAMRMPIMRQRCRI